MPTILSEFLANYASHPHYRAPRGSDLNAHSWQTEAPLRMLLNNLDAEVAEDPENLIVYGGTGQAARDVPSLRKIIEALLNLHDDESLLIQSGKPVAILPTHHEAPRVLIHADRQPGPSLGHLGALPSTARAWADHVCQMTAGSWIYIGTQGILQGTYETFGSLAHRHFDGSLRGRLISPGGLGGMGGAQPLAATLNEVPYFLGWTSMQPALRSV